MNLRNSANSSAARPALRIFTNNPAIYLSLCVGVALSLLAYVHFTNVDEERLRQRILRGTQALATFSSLNVSSDPLLRIFAVLETMQQQVLAGTEPDQGLLADHVFPVDPVTGDATNLRYLPRVELERSSNEFLMTDFRGGKAVFPLTIRDPAVEGTMPVGDKGIYYPILLQAAPGTDYSNEILGVNHYHDDLFVLIMDQARDSGIIASRVSFPLPSASQPFLLFHYYIPLYTPGPAPATISERRERHTGFLSAATFSPAENYINMLPESYLGLEAAYITDSPAFNSDNFAPEILAIMNSRNYAKEQFSFMGDTVHLVARGSYPLTNEVQSPNRWWAVSIGLLLTVWICSLLYFSRVKTARMSALVEQRTRDLEERTGKLTEVNEALAESEVRYRMLADNVSDVIFTCDETSVCTYISPSVIHQTGFTPDEYLGKPFHEQMTGYSADRFKRSLIKVLTQDDMARTPRHGITLEYEVFCKDGSIKIFECSLSVLLGPYDSFNGFMGVARDISERKRSEREKAELEAAFQQSQKMEAIGTLAGGVAHDFNNLLTGILGHTELIKSGVTDEREVAHSLDVIEGAAFRAKDLTSQLLGFARKGHYQSVPVNINRMLEETVALLKRTFDKKVSIKCACPAQQLIVLGDPGQIGQIFLNLAVNARDAMPAGGSLELEISVQDVQEPGLQGSHGRLAPGRYCRILVSDTGRGMALKEQARIFEPFYTNKPKGQGTGLGLAMVYGVTRSHGGMVSVESSPGAGAAFTVYLPLAEDVQLPVTEQEPHDFHSGRGNILVVDDEEIVRELVSAMLERLGYQPFFACDGVEGLAFYQEHKDNIDLVILDVNMPRMGGLECVEKLVECDPDVLIILATGYSQESIQEKLTHPNVCGFLQKPFKMQEFSRLLASCLEQQRPDSKARPA